MSNPMHAEEGQQAVMPEDKRSGKIKKKRQGKGSAINKKYII